jgi:LacI family transcriptional regulator
MATTSGDPAAYALQLLRERVASGYYPAHSLLPSQRDLASEFGVGRAYVRKAITELTRAGLVRAHQGAGTQVLPAPVASAGAQLAFVHSPISGWVSHEGAYLAAGISDRLRALGYAYTRMTCGTPAERTGAAEAQGDPFITLDEVHSFPQRYQAVIFLECSLPGLAKAVMELEQQHFPLVVANLEGDLQVAATMLDHARVSCEAVRILAGFGHRRIAFLSRDPGEYFYGKALEGFRRGVSVCGLAAADTREVFAESTSALAGYLATKPLLRRADSPTAVVAARDILAQGACRAADEAGLAVGYDLSVIGYDDVSWADGATLLTTFHEPCYELGTAAVDLLVERLVNGWRAPEPRLLDAPLVLRRSVGPVPRAATPHQPARRKGSA